MGVSGRQSTVTASLVNEDEGQELQVALQQAINRTKEQARLRHEVERQHTVHAESVAGKLQVQEFQDATQFNKWRPLLLTQAKLPTIRRIIKRTAF